MVTMKVHVPIEIVDEILDCLPLKSLVRFKCASKLWSSLINPIIYRRLHEETERRTRKVLEAIRSIEALYNESKELVSVDDLRASRDRIMAKLDEMAGIADFNGDVDRCLSTLPGVGGTLRRLRACVETLDRAEFSRPIDALIDAAVALQEEAGVA
ncbi:uncharacterized protein A4U43_C07F16620 [Asparagus officinalis]|uniref:F-box domain-containing protein n=1 Tax=Asparagus officinalis TaxID=4686 RepID=A0A5P1EHN8_ASPOF|nr:uncharacterized protein A4U43_C07F16620 [Asparagus officinalis]